MEFISSSNLIVSVIINNVRMIENIDISFYLKILSPDRSLASIINSEELFPALGVETPIT
jgi:hypothetical protein